MVNISHQPCPFCPSSDAFSYDTETGLFRCFVCEATNSSKNGRVYDGENLVDYTPKSIVEEDVEVYTPEEYRGIKKKTLEKCGIWFQKTALGDKAVAQYPGGAYKFRNLWLPKDDKNHFYSMGKLNRLMGIEDYPTSGKYITITEGEWDRASVIQMMGDYPCVNVPGATPSKDFWENTKKDLAGYDKIILSVDNDQAGDALAEKFNKVFPGKVYRVNHGKYKDANDFLQAGDFGGYKSAWWGANRYKPDTILCTAEDFIKLYNETPEHEYFPTGIKELDDKILGIHKGYFTLIKAREGVGKSEFVRYLEWIALTTTNYKIAVCHLEESELRGMLGLVSYDQGVNLTRKDLIEAKGMHDAYEESVKKIMGTEQFHQFSVKTDETYLDVVDRIKYLVAAMDVDFVFLEPIQDVVTVGNTSEKESLLSDFSTLLSRLSSELNVGIVCIAHTNADGEVQYCKMVEKKAGFTIEMSRDSDSDDLVEKNRTYLRVGRKNRVGGGSGPAGALDFDLESYTLTPVEGPKAPDTTNTIDDEGIPF